MKVEIKKALFSAFIESEILPVLNYIISSTEPKHENSPFFFKLIFIRFFPLCFTE